MPRKPPTTAEEAPETTKRPPETRTTRLGSCKTAGMIEAGQVGSTTPVADWHAQCRGGHINERGRVTLCDCPCHEGQHACIECGEGRTELDPDRRCVDREGCLERFRETLANHPRHQAWAKIREAADREKAEKRAEEEGQVAAGTRRPRNGKTPQPCQHCGEMTKGGLFVMGHDAKLKGILMRAGADGDVVSIVELKLRGWFPTAGRGADRYTAGDVRAADELIQEVKTEDFLAERVAIRLEAIAAGADPEQAVRGENR